MLQLTYLLQKLRSKRWQRSHIGAIPVVDSVCISGQLLLVIGWSHSIHNVTVTLTHDSSSCAGIGPVLRVPRGDLDSEAFGPSPGFQSLFELPEPGFLNGKPVRPTVTICINGELARKEKLLATPNNYQLIREFIQSLWAKHHLSLDEAAAKLRTPLAELNQSLELMNSHCTITYSNVPKELSFDLSVVVPLFGNVGLLEHQLMTFQRFRSIYPTIRFVLVIVIDDPRISNQVEQLVRLLNTQVFELPITVVSKSKNTGFASACNLGSRQHDSEYTMFWNSDLFVDRPNSLYVLLETLRNHAELGAVSPVICDPDGTVQCTWLIKREHSIFPTFQVLEPLHRGMRITDFKDSTLCDSKDMELLLPGAALMVRTCLFREVGLFPVRYGIGDFEDGELSYRMRATSELQVVRTPFFHLEGNSYQHRNLAETFCRAMIFNDVVLELRGDSKNR